MKLFIYIENPDAVKPSEILTVHSYGEYVRAGGKRTYMQLYHTLHTKAEEYEYKYISLMDMQFSGIEVNMQRLKLSLLYSQALYLLITEIYGEPLKKVIW